MPHQANTRVAFLSAICAALTTVLTLLNAEATDCGWGTAVAVGSCALQPALHAGPQGRMHEPTLANCGCQCREASCLFTPGLISGWCRFCKPLDGQLVRQMAKNHPVIITVEEGSIGGFGSHGRAPIGR